jgi:23S rRNA-intervening sequence protein
MTINNFTDLLVWQRAMDLVVEIYRITGTFPRSEIFGLTAQTHKSVARGSEGELFTQLEIGRRLGYVSAKDLTKPLADLSEVGRMLNGLIASIEAKIPRHDRYLIPKT